MKRAFFISRIPTQSVGTSKFWLRLLIAILILPAIPIGASAGESGGFDFDAWRRLPVQDGGRYKPFDTLARETARLLGDPNGSIDPQTGRRLDAFEFYLTLLLAGKKESLPRPSGDDYFHIDQPDAWDAAPLLRVDSPALREALGLPANQKSVSPLELAKAKFRDAASGRGISFLREVQKAIIHQRRRPLTDLEQKVLRLAETFEAYRDLRCGKQIALVPLPGDPDGRWLTAEELTDMAFADADDPDGLLRRAQAEFHGVQAAFRSGKAEDFHTASAALFETLEKLGRRTKEYPSHQVIALEVAYNRFLPFRWAWILTAGSFGLSLLGWINGARNGDAASFPERPAGRLAKTSCVPVFGFHYAALTALGLALAVMLAGLAARGVILGWVPLTNMYETVVLLALGSAFSGLIVELFSRRGYVLTAAAAVSTLALILADHCPTILDPSIKPLNPILRSNFWLVIHVKSIMLGYVMFALAWALGNISLGFHLFHRQKHADVADLNKSTYRLLKIGIFLLALGTILGAVWAEYAWGRFWGWDPKEVGALVALLGYLALLHARRIGWIGDLGLAAWSARCFAAIIFTWYIVNFVLGTGMHSYGFGGGGAIYVYGALLLQELYVEAAVLRGVFYRPPVLVEPQE